MRRFSGKIKGSDNYQIVVDSGDINDTMKHATIAIEDKDFYNHSGVSVTGTVRALVNNAKGGSVQGGSTLTQQLVKQAFFTETGEASDRGFGGVPRKIKEAILAINEVERIRNKDQILTLYLNESPYGGRRNGVASGAQTYFGTSAKNLTLGQAALLAAIPQNPAVNNPYNVAGHESLIARQHQVLDNMVAQGYASQKDADAAKAEPICDTLKPETTQYQNPDGTPIKAPHFVQMVHSELEAELGTTNCRKGWLDHHNALDLSIQTKLEEAMATMFNSSVPITAGFTNGAATVEDSQTGRIVALMGSRDFNYPGYGQDNAATAYINLAQLSNHWSMLSFSSKRQLDSRTTEAAVLFRIPTTWLQFMVRRSSTPTVSSMAM